MGNQGIDGILKPNYNNQALDTMIKFRRKLLSMWKNIKALKRIVRNMEE